MTHAQDRDGELEYQLECPVCGWFGVVYYTRKPPRFCSNACKQKAYRQRMAKANTPASENVTALENKGVTFSTKAKIERAIDQALHLCTCPNCKRGLWQTRGNIQIGGVTCGLCGVDFEPVDKRLRGHHDLSQNR